MEMSIVDHRGREVPRTEEGERIPDRGPRIGGIAVDCNTPLSESFRIDEWFDLSLRGAYTLTLRRTVWISGKPHDVTGNAVVISIWPQEE
jgi:hypothetical protein